MSVGGGERIIILAFSVPKNKQEEEINAINFAMQFKFPFVKPICQTYGRPHRAAYWLARKLVEKKYMSQADFYGMAAREALEFYGILPKWDEKKEKKKAIE